MKIAFSQPSQRRGAPSAYRKDIAAPCSSVGLDRLLLRDLLLALLLGCAGCSDTGPSEPAAGCASGGECAEPHECVDTDCSSPPPPRSMSAGRFACTVVNCPSSEPGCCTDAAVTATGNENQGYAIRNQMVSSASSVLGEVRATFSFDAADQQGYLRFDFGSELDLDHLEFTGVLSGVADRFLSVNTNRNSESGCAFGLELEPRSPISGEGPVVLSHDISFNSADFCYGKGRPGRASQLAFAIFATRPGDATLAVSNITLRD